jgi:hypothetical protein
VVEVLVAVAAGDKGLVPDRDGVPSGRGGRGVGGGLLVGGGGRLSIVSVHDLLVSGAGVRGGGPGLGHSRRRRPLGLLAALALGGRGVLLGVGALPPVPLAFI